MNDINKIVRQEIDKENNKERKAVADTVNKVRKVIHQEETVKNFELRTKGKQHNIQNWHNSINDVSKQLLEIKVSVGETLKKVMTFCDELTDSYILQFGKMNIDLFNLVSDIYNYHVIIAKDNENEDYKNAVLSYKEIKSIITENLAAFGIEEIASSVGMRFDRTIHEVVGNENFSTRKSMVKESIRCGFKYGDMVIQKEKICVEDNHENWH